MNPLALLQRLQRMSLREICHRSLKETEKVVRKRLMNISALELTDDQFFRSMHLSEPGLLKIERLVAHGDFASAKTSLRDYFVQRLSPHFYFEPDELEVIVQKMRALFPEEVQGTIERADRICHHYFTILGTGPHDLGPSIPWNRDLTTGQELPLAYWGDLRSSGRREMVDLKFVWELNRHQHFIELGKAYGYTGNEKYAQEFVDEITSWIKANPPEMGINWTEGLEIGLRVVSWIWALRFFLTSSALTPEVFLEILKSLLLQVRHVYRNLSVYTSPNTHLIGEAAALLITGCLFSEFKEATKWLERGKKILEREINRQVGSDGVHRENSIYYHCYALEFYLLILILADKNRIPLSPLLRTRVEKLLEFLMHITRPDGTLPLLGDTDGGRVLRLSASNYNSFQESLSTGAILYGRADFKAVAQRFHEDSLWLLGADSDEKFARLQAKPPTTAFVEFPEAGYSVQRTGWSQKDMHLVFDCGDMGMLTGGHAHADCLSFELFAHGKRLLIDPGTYIYNGQPLWRNYFRGTSAHNTVTVDSLPQVEFDKTFKWKGKSHAVAIRKASTNSFSLVTGMHDGYRRLKSPVTHLRSMLFVKPQYWICLDRFLGEGVHEFDYFFHFPPSAQIDLEKDGSVTADVDNESGVTIVPVNYPQAKITMNTGQIDPIQGWFSNNYGHKQPSPVLKISERERLPLVRANVLIPYHLSQKGQRVRVNQRNDEATDLQNLIRFKVHQNGEEDLFIYSPDAAETEIDGFIFRGELGLLRKNSAGEIRNFFLANATGLLERSRVILKSERSVDFISMELSESGMLVEAEGDGRLNLSLPSRMSGIQSGSSEPIRMLDKIITVNLKGHAKICVA